jgi:hypothetical protein
MRRTVILVLLVTGAVCAVAVPALAQPRPVEPQKVAPGDEIKLDESSALKAAAINSKMQAILANWALLQRQAQDLQTEMNKVLEDRKKLLEDSARRGRVEVREPTEWVYDEANHRYVRVRKNP